MRSASSVSATAAARLEAFLEFREVGPAAQEFRLVQAAGAPAAGARAGWHERSAALSWLGGPSAGSSGKLLLRAFVRSSAAQGPAQEGRGRAGRRSAACPCCCRGSSETRAPVAAPEAPDGGHVRAPLVGARRQVTARLRGSCDCPRIVPTAASSSPARGRSRGRSPALGSRTRACACPRPLQLLALGDDLGGEVVGDPRHAREHGLAGGVDVDEAARVVAGAVGEVRAHLSKSVALSCVRVRIPARC